MNAEGLEPDIGELGLTGEDKKVSGLERADKPPTQSPKEAEEEKPVAKTPDALDSEKSNIFLAEDIAQFRTEMEQKILVEGRPRDEWRKTYEETLANYPQIHPYKDVFDNVVEAAGTAHDRLEAFWNRHQNQEDSANGPTGQGVSSNIFKSVFGFDPAGKVETLHGVITLRFTVENPDYRRVVNLDDKEVLSENAFTLPSARFGFPVVVVRGDLDKEDQFVHKAHEFEHAKNSILASGRTASIGKFRYHPERLTIPTTIGRVLERRSESGLPIEELAGDEILAFFTDVEWVPSSVPKDKVIEFAEMQGDYIEYMLSNKEEDYFTNFRQILSAEQEKRYLENVRRGTEAIVDLFKQYLPSQGPKAARTAINVLEQFPLHSWPAVVYLIKQRHQEAK